MLKHLFFAVCFALLMGPFWSTMEPAGVLANLDQMKSEIHADRCSRSADANCLAGVCMPPLHGKVVCQFTRIMR